MCSTCLKPHADIYTGLNINTSLHKLRVKKADVNCFLIINENYSYKD